MWIKSLRQETEKREEARVLSGLLTHRPGWRCRRIVPRRVCHILPEAEHAIFILYYVIIINYFILCYHYHLFYIIDMIQIKKGEDGSVNIFVSLSFWTWLLV